MLERIKNIIGKDKWPDRLEVNVGSNVIHFNTASALSKKWFYPRYQDGKPHELIVLNDMISNLTADDIFFDVGANIGFYSTVISSISRNTKVHAFEIDPILVSEIQQNFSSNGIINASCLCGAIWNSCDSFVSFSPNHEGNLSTNRINLTPHQSQVVAPTTTLDHYCEKMNTKPTIMKCDIEGSEVHALLGMKNSMDQLRQLYLEVHPEPIKAFGYDLYAISSILKDLDFTLRIAKSHRKATPEIHPLTYEEFESLDSNSMIICSR